MSKQCHPGAAYHRLHKFTVPQRVKTIAAIDFSADKTEPSSTSAPPTWLRIQSPVSIDHMQPRTLIGR